MSGKTGNRRILRAFTGRKHPAGGNQVLSILTYPVKDYVGDYVRPGGGDWSAFEESPLVNWAHSIPVGRGRVLLKSLVYKGKTSPVDVGETQFFKRAADLKGLDLTKYDDPEERNPVGTYSVRECLEAAEQVERLVREDVATGVSIEFEPAGPKGVAYWDLPERSALAGRRCKHFEHWNGLAYAHARLPINPGTRTLLKDPPEYIEKAIRIAETGKFPGGQSVSPIILKSFREMASLASLSRRSTVRVVKADEDPINLDQSGGGEDDLEMTPEDDAMTPDEPSAGVRALLNMAQLLLDGCDALEADAQQSDDISIRKYCAKLCEKLTAVATEAKEKAESLKAKLDKALGGVDDEEEDDEDFEEATDLEGDGDEDEDSDESDEEEESSDENSEPSSEEEDSEEEDDEDDEDQDREVKSIDRDKDGFIIVKSFPNWKPRRFTRSDLIEPGSPAEEELLEKEYERAHRRLLKAKKRAKQLLAAQKANQD